MAKSSAGQKPEKQFRIGPVTAAVFLNIPDDTAKRPWRSVVLQRAYRDEKGNWQYSNSFGLSQMPLAIEVMRCALTFVLEAEQEQQKDDAEVF